MNTVQNQYNYHYLLEIKKKINYCLPKKKLDALALFIKTKLIDNDGFKSNTNIDRSSKSLNLASGDS